MFNPTALKDDCRPLVMGIVNATGDSFSEGKSSAPGTAFERAAGLIACGADLIDLGGESTRPGAREITPAEEIDRVLPVLEKLKREYPDMPVSIDTRHGATARAALAVGADIINDVGLLRDPDLAAASAEFGATLVLCHSRGTPETMGREDCRNYGADIVAVVAAELRVAAASAIAAGVSPDRIWYDPGYGFAKTVEQNWELIRRCGELASLGPLLVGVSRKSFIGALTGEKEPCARLGGTLATELYFASIGARVIRTHAVRELVQALKVFAETFGRRSQ